MNGNEIIEYDILLRSHRELEEVKRQLAAYFGGLPDDDALMAINRLMKEAGFNDEELLKQKAHPFKYRIGQEVLVRIDWDLWGNELTAPVKGTIVEMSRAAPRPDHPYPSGNSQVSRWMRGDAKGVDRYFVYIWWNTMSGRQKQTAWVMEFDIIPLEKK